MSVEEFQEHCRMADGFDLFYRRWKRIGEVKRSVICIHGAGSHSEFFRVMGQDLAADGAEVYALDLRGFGNSKEEGLPRGDTGDFKRHLEDVNEVVDFVRKSHLGKKVYMFGQSIGGCYTLWYAANHPDSLDGIILAAPAIVLGSRISGRDYIRFLFLLLFTPKTMYEPYKILPPDQRESEEAKITLQDPLSTTRLSIRWLNGAGRILQYKALQNASRIKKPTLIIQGEQDKTVLPSGAKRLLESLAAKDKSLQTFPDADHYFYHALFLKATEKHDQAKRRLVTSVVRDWLKDH